MVSAVNDSGLSAVAAPPVSALGSSELHLAALRRVPYFRGSEERVLAGIASSSRLETHAAGHAVFRQGDKARGFYIVVAGQVKVVRANEAGDETVMHLMAEGDFIGEVPLHAEADYPATAVSVSESRLLFVPREVLFGAIRRDPEIAFRLLSSLSRRLLHLVSRFEGLTRQSAGARLARHLLEAADRDGAKKGSAVEIPLALSRTEIGRLVGATRETVSRTLSSWEKSGWISLDRKRVRLLDREALRRILA